MNTPAPSILVVDDDDQFLNLLAAGLQETGFVVTCAESIAAAEHFVRERTLDLILLDLGLAGREGTELLDFLRSSGHLIPTIVISARTDVDERIRTLGLGADDYLIKPFSFAELLARIRAVLRRTQTSDQVLFVGPLRIDLLNRRVLYRNEPVELTLREFDLLAYLARHANTPVSRDTLARDVLRVRSRATPVDNVIEVNISRLRVKLSQPGAEIIQTIRGVGYQLSSAP